MARRQEPLALPSVPRLQPSAVVSQSRWGSSFLPLWVGGEIPSSRCRADLGGSLSRPVCAAAPRAVHRGRSGVCSTVAVPWEGLALVSVKGMWVGALSPCLQKCAAVLAGPSPLSASSGCVVALISHLGRKPGVLPAQSCLQGWHTLVWWL